MEPIYTKNLSARLLAMIVLAIVVLAGSISYSNYRSIEAMYELSYNDAATMANNAVRAFVTDDDIQHYLQILEDQPGLAQRQQQYYAAKERYLQLEEEGAQGREKDAAWREIREFRAFMDTLKDERYHDIQARMNQLLVESSAKYLYVMADTGVPGMYTYIFDARHEDVVAGIDRDDFGSVEYKDMFGEMAGVFASGQAMPEAVFYEDDLFGALYFIYAPLTDDAGNTVAVVGTDISSDEMYDLMQSIILNNLVLAVIVGFVVLLVVYLYLNRLVIRPVNQLATVSTALSEGDLQSEIPASMLKRRDEIGLLAHSVHSFVSTVGRVVSGTKALLEATGRGRLNARSHPEEFKGDYATALGLFNDTLDIFTRYLDNIPEVLFILDPSLQMLYKNKQYIETFGDDSRAAGLVAAALEVEGATGIALAGRAAAATAGGNHTGVCWLHTAAGEEICCNVIICPMGQGREVTSYLVVASDITGLILEKQRAQEANLAKSEFLSRISHELRTPLNTIIGMTHLGLRDAGDAEKAAERYRNISTASDHLLQLINDVLDMSRIESGKIQLRSEPLDFKALARECVALVEAQAKQKGIYVRLTLDDAIPACILGDGMRLRQVFLNLLSNAVKFTEAGGVSLGAKLAEASEAGGVLEVTVADTGIGMSEDFVAKAFTPFEQEELYLKRKYQGTGLGLPVSQGLVQLMGGTIRLESEVGAGSRFFLTIPFEAAPAPGPEPGGEAGAPLLAGRRMLLVDDIEINRIIVIEMLEDTQIDIVEAADGEEALARFCESEPGHFDIVFMDVQMPGMDGYVATKHIRALERPDAGLPIVAMTANAMTGDVQTALESGMTDHLAKPIDYEKLLSVLRNYLGEPATSD